MMKETKMTETAHVYKALAEVVNNLEVDKDSVLPGNMGAAAYRTTEAITAAVRTLFEEHKLILIPNETVVDSGVQEHKNRIVYFIVVQGTYQVVSLEDSSTVTISGTGRGQSTGTAVDANIASTFAFKNALQRLFLIADRTEEDRAHQDSTPGPTKAERQAELARSKAAPKKSPASKGSPVREIQAKVKKEFIDTDVITREQANDEIERLKEKGDKNPFQTLYDALKKGELPDA